MPQVTTEPLLSVSSHASRYGANRRTSPGAFAAAFAINGSVIALLIALPATGIIGPVDAPLPTHWIDLAPPPEPIEPDPVDKPRIDPIKPHPVQKTEDFVITKPIIPTIDNGLLRGTDDLGPINPTTDPVQPPKPAHDPVFKSARQDPRYASAFHPDYPPALVRAGLEGTVTVRVTIDERGRVIACDLVKATDAAFFEETRRQALRNWRFLPATPSRVAVQSQQVLTVAFQLEG